MFGQETAARPGHRHFLTDLANASASGDAARLPRQPRPSRRHYSDEINEMDAGMVWAYLTEIADMEASALVRDRAGSFCRWAVGKINPTRRPA